MRKFCLQFIGYAVASALCLVGAQHAFGLPLFQYIVGTLAFALGVTVWLALSPDEQRPTGRGTYLYHVHVPAERGAGLYGIDDEVTIFVHSGDPGGDSEGEFSFHEHMRVCLEQWYDGGTVIIQEVKLK